MNRVAVVIVNYNTSRLVVDCLHSLAAERDRGDEFDVYLVDNASTDDSVEAVRRSVQARGWGAWLEVLPLERNVGFAAGNNAALRVILSRTVGPDFVLLLNPDTVVRPGAIGELVDFLDAHPAAGLAGSRLEDPDGTPQRSAFRFPSVAGEFENGVRLGPISRLLAPFVVAPPARTEAHPADWLAGASLLVRREVFDGVGLLDEGYFLYFEEVDFCRRVRQAGWECWYVPASRVVHLVGQASGVTDTRKPARRVPEYWFAARRRYFRKHLRAIDARLADVAWAAGFALWRARRRLTRRPDTDPPLYLSDFVRFNFLGTPPAEVRP